MRFCKFLVIVFLLLVNLQGFAQSEKRLVKQAEDAERAGDNQSALDFYLKVLEIKPEDAHLNFKVGHLYLSLPYKHRSLSYLEKSYTLNPKVNHEIHKYLGMAYQYNHQFDKAIAQFKLCKEVIHKDDPFLGKIERHIYECENGKEYMAHPIEAKIVNIGDSINSVYPEFAPVISADESVLIFTSRRQGSTGGQIDEHGEYMEDIYISRKQLNGQWEKPKNIGTNINTEGHDASVGLSANGEELFTYDGTGQGDIKYCKLKKDSTWSRPFKIESINTKFGETSICISPDGSTVFLTSNREDSYGGLDIYRSTLKRPGVWSIPENLGATINTPGNEDGVFLDFDGKTLYFSSQEHKGMGGYDIYKSVYDSTTNRWSEPENLGYPINTADEDIYFVLSGDGKHGYYASVREDGFGEKDIYQIIMPPRKDYKELVEKMEKILKKEIVPETEKQEKTAVDSDDLETTFKPKLKESEKAATVLKGKIFDSGTNKSLVGTVQLLDAKGNVLKEVHTRDDGNYEFDVTFEAQKKLRVTAQSLNYGFTTKDLTVPARGNEKVELIQDLGLSKLVVGAKIVLRNIYYDFDRATLKPESVNELEKLLKMLTDNPGLVIRIGSHTDNYGSKNYNYSLSERRAHSVVSWLVANGISRSRLKFRGYGEDFPIATNDDEAEGRELNRRTEFEILSK